MVHPAEYWRPILARPQEDLPRLRYADWLAERDHRLAEFIRLQCHLGRATDELAHAFHLERRQHELLAEHSASWAGPVAEHVEWWCFRRGFVEEVSLSAGQLLQQAEDLFRHAPLEDLHVTLDGAELESLPTIPALERTVFLDLSAHPLGDAGLTDLARAPFLTHIHGLNLTSCGLGGAGLEALGESPHVGQLRELYLCDNTIDDAGVRQLALSPLLERLETLYLRLNPISAEAAGLLRMVLGARVQL
jgi:uncharacterized protein (TIGR02996 family)